MGDVVKQVETMVASRQESGSRRHVDMLLWRQEQVQGVFCFFAPAVKEIDPIWMWYRSFMEFPHRVMIWHHLLEASNAIIYYSKNAIQAPCFQTSMPLSKNFVARLYVLIGICIR